MSVRFRDENDIRAAEVFDGFPQQAGRQHLMVVERIGGIDQQDVVERAETEILEAVVQNQRVRLKACDGVVAAFDTVFVHDDGRSRPLRRFQKIGGEHERFVACVPRIQKDFFSIGDDLRRKFVQIAGPLGFQAFKEGKRLASIATREDSDMPSLRGERLGEKFDDWRLARPASRQISDADNGAT